MYTLCDAVAQGTLNLINRQYVPMSEQPRRNFALHGCYGVCYVLLAISVAVATASFYVLLVAFLVRAGLFDVVLNLTKHDPLFSVGTSATTDKLVNRAAGLLRTSPAIISGGLRVLCMVAAVALVVL